MVWNTSALNNLSVLEKTEEMHLSCKNPFPVPFRRLQVASLRVCKLPRNGKDSESHLLFPVSGSSYESKLIVLWTNINILTSSIAITVREAIQTLELTTWKLVVHEKKSSCKKHNIWFPLYSTSYTKVFFFLAKKCFSFLLDDAEFLL